jgi:hypothetical protein
MLLLALFGSVLPAAEPPRVISLAKDGKLTYLSDPQGNRVPDFSYAGYMGGGVAIPDAPVRVVVPPTDGDATPRIQAAIEYVSTLPPDAQGIRGAILLPRGRYRIFDQIRIRASGIVLRGEGDGPDGTVLVAAGQDRRTLIQIAGRNDLKPEATPRKISDSYVPVGATVVHFSDVSGLKPGEDVIVRRPSTKEWIDAIGMYHFAGRPGGDFRFTWLPGKMDITWQRRITKIEGDAVTLDAPITTALDSHFGGGTVAAYAWPGRIEQVGIEGLQCESEFDAGNPHDEEHSWIAIGMASVRNAWVRQVTASHFAGSAVSILETCDGITVEDCKSLDPVSELAGYRRHSFYTMGGRTLFQRCHAEHGRRDYAVGYLAAGPNAFVSCDAKDEHDFCGTIESWASGVLFDDVNVDGQIRLDNREIWDQGAGWTAANCMLWNSTAPVITVRNPPGAQNWVFGCWGELVGDGDWGVVNEFIKPDSLYAQQLEERLGAEALHAIVRRDIPAGRSGAKNIEEAAPDLLARITQPPEATKKPLSLQNGWLVCDGKVLAGSRVDVNWWKGRIIPALAPEFGVNLTRFVPGRTGPGLTDDLDDLTDSMVAHSQAILAHHWGLWYDERRQDHEMVRRIDADVWPPFYEQAWARSGQGVSWNGLSKYDLTKFNPWYFGRLKRFADLCDRKGLVLENQMYFQHNILEAGAHWVDTPWRPANALQDLGFPEPPAFIDRKRIAMADMFYDVSDPRRREFHRQFIRKSLDNLADNTNVIQAIGEEFTGPLSFVQFWLDTVAEWERDTGKHPLIALSCTKDVQDAILADPERSKLVSVIEFKYWWPISSGKVFAPAGGQSLAPRQQIRENRGKTGRSEPETERFIRDYRLRYPDKAILCAYDRMDGAAALAAGASIVPFEEPHGLNLLAAIATMHPVSGADKPARQWTLADPGRSYLAYTPGGAPASLELADGAYSARWIEAGNGSIKDAGQATGGGTKQLAAPGKGEWFLWLTRQ